MTLWFWRCWRCEILYCNMNKGSKGYVCWRCQRCQILYWTKNQRRCWRCQKWCLQLLWNAIYRVMLLMSEVLKVNSTLYTGPRIPPEGKAIWKAFHLVGLAVHHQSVWGGSFVNFLGVVKLEGWLQARHTSNLQLLKLRGHSATQLFLHIYRNKAASSIP